MRHNTKDTSGSIWTESENYSENLGPGGRAGRQGNRDGSEGKTHFVVFQTFSLLSYRQVSYMKMG